MPGLETEKTAVSAASDRKSLTIFQMLESDGPGGAEMVVFQLAEELRRRGHSVVPVGPCDGVGWLGDKFRAAGFEPQTYVEGRPPDLILVRHLAQMMRRFGADAVHSHEFSMAVYGAAAARRVGIPHVITMHGHQTMTAALRRRIAVRWAFRRSAANLAVSSATQRQLMADLGIGPDRLSVIRNGVPEREGNPEPVRRELGLEPDEVLLLAVGNLDYRKGHLVLLEALEHLRAGGLDARWRVAIAAGRGGDERPKLEAFAAEHGFAERLHILEQRSDIPDLQAAADVFCMPSRWEGLPLAILEAMLAGNPVVASETSGIPEAITSGEHGILTPPGDVAALAEALGALLVDPGLRRRLGAAARERALAEFTIGKMTDAYERCYRPVNQRPERPSRSANREA
jgi:glycosyltransferase involved in cell wall biosynthesis